MQGTYWLTVLPETSKLRPGIKRALSGVERDAKLTPTFDTKGAKRAGAQAGRDVQSGMESTTRGGGLGRLLRIDGARNAGQNAGREVNAGIASANIGAGASAQMERNMTSGASGLGKRLGSMIGNGLKVAAVGAGTVAAAGLGAALTSGFKRLTAIDDAQFKLKGLGNSAEQVQGIMDNALVAVKGTAFGLDEAATTAATAVAAGIAPGEQLTGYLKLTADTAAIAGTSLADMGGIFNSVQTSGKAMTGDLRMLADRGLPVFTWLQEATGKTGEEFQKFVEDGGISSEMFREAVASNIGGAAQAMGGSVRGSLSNLKASFSRFGAELSGPIFAGLKPLAIGLTGVFDSVTAAVKPVMADLTATVGPWAEEMAAKIKAWADNGGMEKIVAWFGRMRDTIAGLMSGGGSGAMASIADSAKQLGPALQNAGPALAGVGDAAKAFGQAMITVGPETLSSVMVPALSLLATTLKFVADNASWAVPTIVGLAAAFIGFRAVGQVLGPVVGLMNGALRVINAPLILAQTAAIRSQAAAMTQLTAALGANTVSSTTNTVAQNANAATTVRGRIATLAAAAASKVATAAQWLWNAALTANPIGLIIAGVVAAGVAIWAFFTKTETGRKLWDKIWTAIKTTVSTVWSWLKATLSKAWEVVGPALAKIGEIARQAFGIGVQAVKAFGDVIGWLWNNVAVPAFSAIGSAISTWWSGVKAIWGFATTALEKVGSVVGTLKDGFVTAFNAIKDVVTNVWNSIKSVIDSIASGIGGVVDKLRGMPVVGSLIPGNADGRASGFAGGRPASVSRSGVVSGPGTGTSDSILARISNDEGIVKASAMRNGGGVLVAALNAGWVPPAGYLHSMLPGFAEGLNPGADWLRSTIMQTFPSIGTVGGKRSEDGYGEHSSGNAIDVMIPGYNTPAGKATGDKIASWVAQNRDQLGVDGMIWRQTSFGYGGDWSSGKVMGDRGSDTQNHLDHLHIILGKGRGAGAAAVDEPADTISLASSLSGGGGPATSLGASTSAAAGSSRAVQSARTSLRDAGQSVDDRTYARDRAQRRLDEAKAAGKDTADAQRALDVANRELADAKEKQRVAGERLTEAEQKAATETEKSSDSSSSGVGGLGKSLVDGFFETIGLDGSLFSNPFEWPTIKSLMAGVNVLGAALSGGSGSATSSTGAGGDPSGILGAFAESSGLDMLTNLNPAADNAVAPATNVAPDTTQHGAGNGQAPGVAPVYIENAGMSPADVSNRLNTEWNHRTRTTKVR